MELSSQASFSDAHEIVSLPIIAANLHRVISPAQSQIWAVLRAKDTDSRIYWSMCAAFLGRMGLSGDVYDLSEHQWALADEGIAFYKKAAPIIKDGKTTFISNDVLSYNYPRGGQLVIREYDGKKLFVYHRFADSVPFEEYLKEQGINTEGLRSLEGYGSADEDFSAEAKILY